jgi:hypothetical protein
VQWAIHACAWESSGLYETKGQQIPGLLQVGAGVQRDCLKKLRCLRNFQLEKFIGL